MNQACVSLEEVFAAAGARAASLVPETSGYLTLAVADATSRLPYHHDDRAVLLTVDGSVMVPRKGAVAPPAEAARGLRDLLRRLLGASSGSMPGLASAARPRSEESDVDRVVGDIEGALIPVNRSAAKRALARLSRETLRAKELGKLRKKPPQAPAATGGPTTPATTSPAGPHPRTAPQGAPPTAAPPQKITSTTLPATAAETARAEPSSRARASTAASVPAGPELVSARRQPVTAGQQALTAGQLVPTADQLALTADQLVPTAGQQALTADQLVPTADQQALTADQQVPTAGLLVPTAGRLPVAAAQLAVPVYRQAVPAEPGGSPLDGAWNRDEPSRAREGEEALVAGMAVSPTPFGVSRLREQASRLREEASRLREEASRPGADASRVRADASRLQADASRLREDVSRLRETPSPVPNVIAAIDAARARLEIAPPALVAAPPVLLETPTLAPARVEIAPPALVTAPIVTPASSVEAAVVTVTPTPFEVEVAFEAAEEDALADADADDAQELADADATIADPLAMAVIEAAYQEAHATPEPAELVLDLGRPTETTPSDRALTRPLRPVVEREGLLMTTGVPSTVLSSELGGTRADELLDAFHPEDHGDAAVAAAASSLRAFAEAEPSPASSHARTPSRSTPTFLRRSAPPARGAFVHADARDEEDRDELEHTPLPPPRVAEGPRARWPLAVFAIGVLALFAAWVYRPTLARDFFGLRQLLAPEATSQQHAPSEGAATAAAPSAADGTPALPARARDARAAGAGDGQQRRRE